MVLGELESQGGLIAIGAGIAAAGGAFGTAWAQASIGSAAMGVIAERPEKAGSLIIFLALPELIVVIGFLVAYFLIGKIGAEAAVPAEVN